MRKSKRRVAGLSAAALAAVCSQAAAVNNGQALPAAANELLQLYPGTRVHKEQDRVRILYGAPMTVGADARTAAANFIQQHGEAFGCGALELQELYHVPLRDGAKAAICYQQFIGGIPVEYGTLRVLVLNQPVPRVVYAAGTLAAAPADGFAAPAVDGETAVALVRKMPLWRNVPQWSQPQLVVFQGDGDWAAPTLAWKFVGESPDPNDALCRTFFVSAATGQVLHIRNEILDIDVEGTIRGMGSGNNRPDEPYNPPMLLDVPEMRASISGGGNAYTNADGEFLITHPGTAPVTVSAGVNGAGAGRWVNVVPQSGVTPVAASMPNVTPPGPADLVLNPNPSEFLTAQVNAFVGTTVTHDYFKSRAPGFTGLDVQLRANTGVSGTCNAFFTAGSNPPSSSSINFYNRASGCANTAYSSVISHEYGHFIVNRLFLSQGAFGEGFGDTVSMLLWDDHIVGRGFRQSESSFVRDPIGANVQYPCPQGGHFCGQVLGATWWRIRTNMGAFYGSEPGLEMTRQMQVEWALITSGGPNSSNSAGPSTAIEVLTVDDNDGNLANGTPNYSRICAAYAAHNIQCPPLSLIFFEYPGGRPVEVTPGEPAEVQVRVVANTVLPEPGTGQVSYRIGGGSFTTVPMVETAPNEYTAMLPAAPCGHTIDYYFTAQASAGTAVTDPPDAPAVFFTTDATLGTTSTTVVDLDFNTAPTGWTVTNTSLTSGQWERVTPANPAAGQGAPATASGGSGMCWVTDNRVGNFDVDGGPTVLTTEVYDLSDYARVTVSYDRWLYSTGNDPWTFEYSTNGGSTWTALESVAGTTSAAWTNRSFNLVAPTSQMRFRWTISDNPNNSVAEGGVDSFKIVGTNCTPTCYANCDGSTVPPVLNVNDFLCFQAEFAAGSSYANCDGSTKPPVLNVNDFICFQGMFVAGCR